VLVDCRKDIEFMTTNEKELAEKLGVPRSVLRGFRKEMKEGSDWGKVKGKIEYTAAGIEVIEEKLGLREIPEGFYFKDKEYRTLHVTRANFINKRIIHCEDDEGESYVVRVRSNENYRPYLTTGKPMMVKARKDEDGWTHEGRGPRYVGRW